MVGGRGGRWGKRGWEGDRVENGWEAKWEHFANSEERAGEERGGRLGTLGGRTGAEGMCPYPPLVHLLIDFLLCMSFQE